MQLPTMKNNLMSPKFVNLQRMSDFELKTNIKIAPTHKLKLINLPEGVVTQKLHKRQVHNKIETAATALQRRLRLAFAKRHCDKINAIKKSAALKI
jgi:hypothetical protein